MRELEQAIGYDGIKKELYRIIDLLQYPEKYKAIGISTPKGILLNGQPVIEKTLIYNHLDATTGVEVARYYNETKRILIENRKFLEELASSFLRRRLYHIRISAIIREKYKG